MPRAIDGGLIFADTRYDYAARAAEGTQMIDLDKGVCQYHSAALGELLCQRDAKHQSNWTPTIEYDLR